MRITIKKAVSMIIVTVMILTLCCACTQKFDTVDYSQSENWAYYGVGEGKSADLPYRRYGKKRKL